MKINLIIKNSSKKLKINTCFRIPMSFVPMNIIRTRRLLCIKHIYIIIVIRANHFSTIIIKYCTGNINWLILRTINRWKIPNNKKHKNKNSGYFFLVTTTTKEAKNIYKKKYSFHPSKVLGTVLVKEVLFIGEQL